MPGAPRPPAQPGGIMAPRKPPGRTSALLSPSPLLLSLLDELDEPAAPAEPSLPRRFFLVGPRLPNGSIPGGGGGGGSPACPGRMPYGGAIPICCIMAICIAGFAMPIMLCIIAICIAGFCCAAAILRRSRSRARLPRLLPPLSRPPWSRPRRPSLSRPSLALAPLGEAPLDVRCLEPPRGRPSQEPRPSRPRWCLRPPPSGGGGGGMPPSSSDRAGDSCLGCSSGGGVRDRFRGEPSPIIREHDRDCRYGDLILGEEGQRLSPLHAAGPPSQASPRRGGGGAPGPIIAPPRPQPPAPPRRGGAS